jgi:hypothetical protein
VSSSGISTAVVWELPARSGSCGGAATSAAVCATAVADSCCGGATSANGSASVAEGA